MSEGPVLKAGMTVGELVDAIVAYYSVDPVARRSLCSLPNGGMACVYNGPDGKHCAFYWLVKDPSRLEDNENGTITADVVILRDGEECLKEEVRHLPPGTTLLQKARFFRALQRLHDTQSYWSTTGLTPQGLSEAFNLKNR